MAGVIFDGKRLAKKIEQELTQRVHTLKEPSGARFPREPRSW